MGERINTKQIFIDIVFALTVCLWIYAEFQEEFPPMAGEILGAFLCVGAVTASFERFHASKKAYGIVVIPACYELLYPFIAHNTFTFAASVAGTVWMVAMMVYAKYADWKPKNKDQA